MSHAQKLIQQDTPTRVMGIKLGRTPEAVQQHANENGLSTKPVNQSPCNRRKKIGPMAHIKEFPTIFRDQREGGVSA